MADFRQLALDFVLEDDQAKLTSFAQKAASEIQNAAANTNPVARWVEAVQPWMPGSNDDDVMQNGPDWTARAKALDFLSQTLDFLSKDSLKPSQVKLLVAFFGAMFDVDHKAGIKASATALSQIIAMKSFQPQSGHDIIQKVCTLKDDFPRQVSKTRLAVYELLRSLITDAAVASDLQSRDAASQFMKELLHLCQLERDPDCLMIWFDLLTSFMKAYSPSQEMLEEVYGSFKAYFPITLPRASQSIVTPDELKLKLRECFCATDRLAPLALPFLVGKLDQGDGVTVNVKVDVLRTIRACIESYDNPEQSVTPFVNRIWGSLKYEVRNGEVEDTIWATLEVLKAVTSRLKDEELRDYTLTVTRDCVNDLSNPTYTAAAGRLLISVLSAKPSAFVLMVAPALTHIKENLRHPKSPMHSQDLFKILRIILETRLLLTGVQMTDQERADFAAVDSIFKSLYNDVYKKAIEQGSTTDASYDDVKVSTEAVQGAGALVCQRVVTAATTHESQTQSYLLLPEGICTEICDVLFSITSQARDENTRSTTSDDLVNESIQALQRAVQAYPRGFKPLVERGVAIVRKSYSNPGPQSVATIQRLCSTLAYVGYLDLRQSLTNGLRNFLCLSHVLATELLVAIDSKADPSVWSAFVGGIHSAALYFNDAFIELDPKEGLATAQDYWFSGLIAKFPELNTIGIASKEQEGSRDQLLEVPEAQRRVPDATPAAEFRNDGLLITLFVCRLLYRRATKPVEAQPSTGKNALDLSDDFTGSDKSAEDRYLHQLSKLVDFVVFQMGSAGISSPQMETYFFSLFRDDFISIPISVPAGQQIVADNSWNWLALGPLNVLSLGILKSLRPSGVTQLYDMGVAQQILLNGTSLASSSSGSMVLPVARAIMAALANKYPLEGLADVMATLEQNLRSALEQASTGSSTEDRHNGSEQALTIFTLAGGLLRRCTGKQTQGLRQLLREAPNDRTSGYRLAQGLETIVAPQTYLTKAGGAVEKPLWMQKVYIDLVKPMISNAVGASPEAQDPLIKAHFSVGVLHMVKHMNFSIYEDDSDKIVRIAIMVAQNMGIGADAMAAVEVLKNVLVEAPERAQDRIRSLITVCINLFSSRAAATQARPEWLPRDHVSSVHDTEIEAGCGKLALEIVGSLPRMFESRYLLAHAPQVQRELCTACGHRVRDVRRTARLARAAWSDVK